MSGGLDPKRIAQAGSLVTPSILRRNPKLARQIRARRLNKSAPASNQWGGALTTLNSVIKTLFAIIGAIAVLVVAMLIKGAQ